MIRLDGKEVALSVRTDIKQETEEFVKAHGYPPGLAVILVGDDPASGVYVRNKEKACAEMGFLSRKYELPADTRQADLLALIDTLNRDPLIHGILVQLPLPKTIDENAVILAIDPEKDVDAFHPANVGRIVEGNYSFVPCTPAGIMEILKYYRIPIAGKKCVVIGRSNIVGKPMALLLLEQNGTVTICHSKTENLAEMTRTADILVVAVGRAKFVNAEMVKPGAVVIDVGINRTPDGKVVGDVDYESISLVANAATPVPGGVGPMTITMLMRNTLTAAKRFAERKKQG